MSAAIRIDDLEDLSLADRKALYERLHFEFQGQGAEASIPQTSRVMWDAIQSAVARFAEDPKLPPIKVTRIPLAATRKAVGAKKFDAAMEYVDEFVERSCGILMRRGQRMIVIEECLLCLCQYIRSARAPVTALTVVRNIDKMAEAVNRAFPGYAKARLLHVVVTLKR